MITPMIIKQRGRNNLSIVLSLTILSSVSRHVTPIRKNMELPIFIPFESILAILGRINSSGQKSKMSILSPVNSSSI